tara:strand:+ start:113 stop:601 length:489 start_codon:yes stop_codon:yes gene_type:complete
MKKIAIYPGTFDPITNGHKDIIKRSSLLFDELIIAVTDDNNKKTMFEMSQRIKMINHSLDGYSNIKVEKFSGLLVDYAKAKKADAIIRGLRVLSDFEYEFKMAMMNRNLNRDIDTLFLMPNSNYVHISSSLVKEVAILGGDISEYVSPFVLDEINKKVDFGK